MPLSHLYDVSISEFTIMWVSTCIYASKNKVNLLFSFNNNLLMFVYNSNMLVTGNTANTMYNNNQKPAFANFLQHSNVNI